MSQYKPFQIEIDGRVYSGSWELSVGMLHVSSAYGSKSAAASDHPVMTAERLLREIVLERSADRP